MCIFTCDIYACTHHCVCIQKVCVTYTCSIYFAYIVLGFFWRGLVFVLLFCFNPLSAFSIPAGYDICSFAFRSPFWKVHTEYKMLFWEKKKKENKKNNIKKQTASTSCPCSPLKSSWQSEWETYLNTQVRHTRMSHSNVRHITVFRIFPLDLCIHIPMHIVRNICQNVSRHCDYNFHKPWLGYTLRSLTSWEAAWKAEFQYAEHTVAGLRDVNQDISGEEVTLLSGWLSGGEP